MSFRVLRYLLAAAALTAGLVDAQLARPLVGRTVQSVIEELRDAGAPLVYSSSLLPATLLVAVEPRATQPLEIAREILAPHGLTLRSENGSWLIVSEPQRSPGVLVVEATSGYAGMPLGSFSVQVDGPTRLVVNGVNGRAELPALAPGSYAVTVRSPGFLPERLTSA